jgi:ATP-dependent Clp protease ATP-binding subunit ClpC
MSIEVTLAAKERLIDIGFDPALGARPLRRAIQRELEDRLSEKILEGALVAGDHVHVDLVDGEFVFTTTSREPVMDEATLAGLATRIAAHGVVRAALRRVPQVEGHAVAPIAP